MLCLKLLNNALAVGYRMVPSNHSDIKLIQVISAALLPAFLRASAPSWTETLRPHFLAKRPSWEVENREALVANEDDAMLVVRNTFLELREVPGVANGMLSR